MMEVMFSRSACGSLRRAQSGLPRLGSGRADLFCFDLNLSVGDLSGGCLSEVRTEALLRLYSIFPEIGSCVRKNAADAAGNLPRLLERAARGEIVRLWYSENPDEYCGACWLMQELSLRTASPELRLMKLPNQWEDGHSVRLYQGWGEVCPEEFAALLPLERPAIPAQIAKAKGEWAEALALNTPLRAFVNGRLHSVPAEFYDPFIRREIDRAPAEFSEAEVIGNVLGRYQLKLGDLWVAVRIEEMIRRGELVSATEAKPGEPVYRRLLRKTV